MCPHGSSRCIQKLWPSLYTPTLASYLSAQVLQRVPTYPPPPSRHTHVQIYISIGSSIST
ncbi:hypothetical protein TWF751_009279, partial [Orbilia oligospora]